jgi:hypothetical protein
MVGIEDGSYEDQYHCGGSELRMMPRLVCVASGLQD